jgi:hypothetical protein
MSYDLDELERLEKAARLAVAEHLKRMRSWEDRLRDYEAYQYALRNAAPEMIADLRRLEDALKQIAASDVDGCERCYQKMGTARRALAEESE